MSVFVYEYLNFVLAHLTRILRFLVTVYVSVHLCFVRVPSLRIHLCVFVSSCMLTGASPPPPPHDRVPLWRRSLWDGTKVGRVGVGGGEVKGGGQERHGM